MVRKYHNHIPVVQSQTFDMFFDFVVFNLMNTKQKYSFDVMRKYSP